MSFSFGFAVDEFDWNLMQHPASTTNGRNAICWDEEELPAFFKRETRRPVEERDKKKDNGDAPSHRGIHKLVVPKKQIFLHGADLTDMKVPGSVYLDLKGSGVTLVNHAGTGTPFLTSMRAGPGKSFAIAL